tara:strand:- start:278 stop:1120 length:843 start_codon:yes stop_codon:yes gene_type:complete
MAKLPILESPTLLTIDRKIEEGQDDWRRAHLGASLIGHSCDRFLWYSFRWFSEPEFQGRILRLFRRGHGEEINIVADLRLAGVEVSEGPKDGEQWRFESLGGHFGGSMDAAVLGLLEAPKTWHVAEFKTHNKKSFDALVKDKVEKSKPQHYAQMQSYMHKSGMSRAVYIAVCKDDDRYYLERIHYDKYFSGELEEKANRVIFSKQPLQRISERPDYFMCKWCQHYDACHRDMAPQQINCRTCTKSSPKEDGSWFCGFKDSVLTLDDQKTLAQDCRGYSAR